jgi:hypothetical protein
MRRTLLSLVAAGLLGTLAGCHCVAGKCDCTPDESCTQCQNGGHADFAGPGIENGHLIPVSSQTVTPVKADGSH